jgi:hypothetical protein
MTLAQITAVLAELETQDGENDQYILDEWLSMPEVAEIMLSTNENIYPDNKLQVMFDSENELLWIRRGTTSTEGQFTSEYIEAAINFSNIMGLAMVRAGRYKSPYQIGAQV